MSLINCGPFISRVRAAKISRSLECQVSACWKYSYHKLARLDFCRVTAMKASGESHWFLFYESKPALMLSRSAFLHLEEEGE